MRYIIFLILIIPCLYTFSFAKYNWHIKKRMAAIGTFLIGVASILSSAYMVFIKF